MLFISGLIVFLSVHLLPAVPAIRARLVAQMGAGAYKIVFSLVSLASFVALVIGFGEARMALWNIVLWTPPTWTKHIAFALMLPAMILIVAAYVPSRIRTRAKHPMLAAIKIWALAHLIANGDLVGIILFVAFLGYGVVDRISVKRREALGPLGDKQGGAQGDAIVLVVGLALWAFMLLRGHAWLIGVPLLDM